MALDHVRTWKWLLEAGLVPQFAHMTLMRAAFEGTATALWLVDEPDSAERVRRAANLGLEDLHNRRAFEALVASRAAKEASERGQAATPFDWGTAKSGSDRYGEFLVRMTDAGIEKGAVPKYTELIEIHGPGAHVYSLTSAFAHRREWSMAFSEEVNRIDDTGMPGSGALQITPSPTWAVRITESVMVELETALMALEAHMGVAGRHIQGYAAPVLTTSLRARSSDRPVRGQPGGPDSD